MPVVNSIIIELKPSSETDLIFFTFSRPVSFFSMGMVIDVYMSGGVTTLYETVMKTLGIVMSGDDSLGRVI